VKKTPRWFAVLTCGFAVLFSVTFCGAQGVFSFTELTHTFQTAPVPAKTASVYPFASNNQKQVAFIGDDALFERATGHTSLLAALGMVAPGGGKFLDASTPAVNNAGQIVFRGDTSAPSSSGLFLYSGGSIMQLVPDGPLVASGGDIVYPTAPSVNDAGTVAFLSFSRNGLFVLSNNVVQRLAAPGDPAPDGDSFIDFQSCSINQPGDIVFKASMLSGNTGIYLASGGTITKIAKTGDFLNGGMIFTFLGSASVNDLSQVAVAGLANGPVAASGVYLYSNGTITVPVPNFTPLPAGGTLTLVTAASVNNSGQIGLISQTSNDPSGRGSVFVFSGGSLTQIMAPGQALPGGDFFTGAFDLSVDDSGRVVFVSRTQQHNDALFRYNGRNLFRIAGQGDPVAAKPAFSFPFAYGLASGRVLVFSSTFPGGTGLFSAAKGNASDVKLVAHVGQKFDGEGVIQGIFENFEMSTNGNVIFDADLSGGHGIIFHKAPGQNLTALVRASFDGTGDISPDGTPFLGVRQVSINAKGQYGFAAFTSSKSGIYLSDHGVISLAVDANAPLPDGSGPLGTVSLNALNDQGQIAFLAQSFPSPNGIILASAAQLTSIAREGDAAPGGGNYSLGFPDPAFGPAINNAGSVAFASDLSTGGRGVFVSSAGTVSRIAGPGDVAPGGGSFVICDSPRINSLGQVAFFGQTSDGSFGAFVFSGGSVSRVAATGDVALPSVMFTYVSSPVINDLGEIAFGADLSDGTVATFLATPISGLRAAGYSAKAAGQQRLSISLERAQMLKARHPRPLTHGGRSPVTQ
jgi:hypothetical protein